LAAEKSIVCEVFRKMGIPVYEADAEARKLYDHPDIAAEVKKAFGEKYFTAGKLNRTKFAGLVFQDPEALTKINRIIHPQVKKNFKDWKKQFKDKPYVLKEAAILFESGSDSGCDRIISVLSAGGTSCAALPCNEINVRRNKSNRSSAGNGTMIGVQPNPIFVITNDETRLVIPQVLEIHEQLLSLSQSK
jgi:dephospho-CoA kinase